MVLNLFKLLALALTCIFFMFISKHYFSEKNLNIIKINRDSAESRMLKSSSDLPLIANDTYDAIEFNSGFNNNNEKSFKRNFWDLFK